jgi:hypothetical protein
MSDHITTFTGEFFHPLEPEIEKIKVEDIAHALSLMCRANGHIHSFFSVAQHSINCCVEAEAREYSKRIQLACLLHDASEAYISDITRPVKKELPRYLEIEDNLQGVIFNKFFKVPLTDDELKKVFEIDDAMLYHEFLHFMNLEVMNIKPELINKPSFDFKHFKTVENTFIDKFNCLFE